MNSGIYFLPSHYIRILTHIMWGVCEPSLILENEAMQRLLIETVDKIAEKKGFIILASAAHTDHLHLVVEIGKNQKVARIAHTLQEMSADFFLKEFGLTLPWQDTFLAVSVARKELGNLKQNLANHNLQHRHKNFRQELFEILENE